MLPPLMPWSLELACVVEVEMRWEGNPFGSLSKLGIILEFKH